MWVLVDMLQVILSLKKNGDVHKILAAHTSETPICTLKAVSYTFFVSNWERKTEKENECIQVEKFIHMYPLSYL